VLNRKRVIIATKGDSSSLPRCSFNQRGSSRDFNSSSISSIHASMFGKLIVGSERSVSLNALR
jgi:hypothetical protein